jgi:L-arabinokinase
MTDEDAFLELLRSRRLFEPGTALTVTRAPGRLDVMGGIADYSGSLVLQRPIAEATYAAVQRIDDPILDITSIGRSSPCVLPLAMLAPEGEPLEYEDARGLFLPGSERHWAAYVAGLVVVLMRERGVRFQQGARIAIASSVPEGKGVSSSAAIETAAMQALATAFGISLGPLDVALLCQKAENLVAGAPCGVMDQMTCVFGEADSLLALLCQPAELQTPVRVPDDIEFWGLDSGERHAVGGSDYSSVRTGAFMGLRIITDCLGAPTAYLADITPADFERELVHLLPDEVSGEEFLARHGGTADTVTVVDPGRVYRVRQPASHPVYDHDRVKMFRQLLLGSPDEERRIQLGALMYRSHASYSACGLGSPGTDLLVDLVRGEGTDAGLYGARITGGGSGGTVAVVGRRDAGAAIDRVAQSYGRLTGYHCHVFTGSSGGVASFGSRRVIL